MKKKASNLVRIVNFPMGVADELKNTKYHGNDESRDPEKKAGLCWRFDGAYRTQQRSGNRQ